MNDIATQVHFDPSTLQLVEGTSSAQPLVLPDLPGIGEDARQLLLRSRGAADGCTGARRCLLAPVNSVHSLPMAAPAQANCAAVGWWAASHVRAGARLHMSAIELPLSAAALSRASCCHAALGRWAAAQVHAGAHQHRSVFISSLLVEHQLSTDTEILRCAAAVPGQCERLGHRS